MGTFGHVLQYEVETKIAVPKGSECRITSRDPGIHPELLASNPPTANRRRR
jgi:hypothetical protein